MELPPALKGGGRVSVVFAESDYSPGTVTGAVYIHHPGGTTEHLETLDARGKSIEYVMREILEEME